MIIIGAGGFAKEILHVLSKIEPPVNFAFYDDITENKGTYLFDKFPVFNDTKQLADFFSGNGNHYIIGVGKPALRKYLFDKINGLGGKCIILVSPTADIGKFGNEIGEGVIIMDNVLVETSNKIGKGCLVHYNSFISHDVQIGDFCEISPCVKLLGNTKIGDGCAIGTGAIVLPGVTIGNNVIVGAGTVVTRDVPDNETIVGNTIRTITKNISNE
jgi:sugar O-acyltransferase (sialic acid O-acetyltransferase NeuD family)